MIKIKAGNKRDFLLITYLVIVSTYVVFIPVSNNLVLYSLLISLAVLSVISIIKNKPKIPKALLVPGLIWLSFVAYAVLVAILQHAAYWPRTLVFLLFWPLVFSVISLGFRTKILLPIMWVGAISTIIISLLFVYDFLSISVYPALPDLPKALTEIIHLRNLVDAANMYKLTSHSLPSLIWWGGIWIASLFCNGWDKYLPPTWIRLFAAFLALTAAFVAWRRAIVVVLIAAPLIALVTYLFLKFKTGTVSSPRFGLKNLSRLVLVFVGTMLFAVMFLPQISSQFSSLLHSTVRVGTVAETPISLDLRSTTIAEDDQLSDVIRQNELANLTKPDSPTAVIFGNGIGAEINRGSLLRDIRPWQTELQYQAMFYWTGIVGIAFLVATLITALLAVRKAFQLSVESRPILFVTTVGALCLLAANASNPYLQAPGHMWPLFLPLMISLQVLNSSQQTKKIRER